LFNEDMKDVIQIFLVESQENLDKLDRDFIEWEKKPEEKERLDNIFRTMHTMKGMSGCLGFGKLEKIAHSGENILQKLRDGEVGISPDLTNTLLRMVDAVREILASLENQESEGETDYSKLLEDLLRIQADGDGLKPAEAGSWSGVPSAAVAEKAETAKKAETAAIPVPVAAETAGETAVPGAKEILGNPKAATGRSLADTSLRVDVALLDMLMNEMGELVLSRNHIQMVAAGAEDPVLKAAAQRLNRITSKLQEGLLKTRMQPIDSLFGKYPRMVRDIAKSCGKEVRLELVGRETELDKGLIEAMKDPLTHLLRNSVDHGIETPAARTAAGKTPEGLLCIKAYHESGQVVVEIADDGAGIRVEKIKAKALEKGLITAEAAAVLSEKEAINLIFLPGFSTAETVTNVSGRGVGMDVVRTNIEKISGSIDITTQPGKGTTIKIRLPLTLAIIPALLVECAGETLAIPQVNLVEVLRLEGEKRSKGIEAIDNAPVLRLRGGLLPLIHLRQALGFDPGATAGIAGSNEGTLQIIVLQHEDTRFGLVVDRVGDSQEIVVKPLAKALKDLQTYAGATILGNGRVALILDVQGLAERACIASADDHAGRSSRAGDHAGAAQAAEKFLVFRSGAASRLCIPLGSVARLVKINSRKVETAGPWSVLQFQDEILPLLYLDRVLGGGQASGAPEGDLQIIFCRCEGRLFGLVVDSISDIVAGDAANRRDPVRDLVTFNFVLDGQVTEMIDLKACILSADPIFFERQLRGQKEATA
jgi:two-component system chemotaxis sensor kinase CheA